MSKIHLGRHIMTAKLTIWCRMDFEDLHQLCSEYDLDIFLLWFLKCTTLLTLRDVYMIKIIWVQWADKEYKYLNTLVFISISRLNDWNYRKILFLLVLRRGNFSCLSMYKPCYDLFNSIPLVTRLTDSLHWFRYCPVYIWGRAWILDSNTGPPCESSPICHGSRAACSILYK